MIRRAHQIAVSLFLEETGELGITNRQYGIMLVLKARARHRSDHRRQAAGPRPLHHRHGADQAEHAGLVGRVVGASDRRKRSLKLTPAGERMLERLAEPARRAQERVLSAFSPRERKTFLDLLDKFARAFNDTTRVPQVVQRHQRRRRQNARSPSPPHLPPSAALCYHSGKEPAAQPQVRQPGRSDMEGHDNGVVRRTVLMSAGVGIGAGLVSGLSSAQGQGLQQPQPRQHPKPKSGARTTGPTRAA